jgi:hypothetical protein
MQSTVDNQSSLIEKKRKYQAIISAASTLAVNATINTSLHFFSRKEPQSKRTSGLRGGEYIQELLDSAHPERIQEVLRMKLKPFETLCKVMRETNYLHNTRHITVEEQLAMFLHIVGKGSGFRDTEERYQHSGETIHRHFHAVLDGLVALVPKYIKPPSTTEIPDAITTNPKFYPFFQDALGAVDGTHIAAKVYDEEMGRYRNRKGFLSQNVMACCDFDKLTFTYVLAGWEGSAHDGLVFDKSFDYGFSIPEGKYYLGDAGYPLTPYCLTPYRGVRYHLHEWGKSGQKYALLVYIANCE